jgi:hypothetical protein
MEQRLWARAIEELEKTPRFPNPRRIVSPVQPGTRLRGDILRSQVVQRAAANLFKAQEYYDQAADMNREQKYFVEVVAR